MLLRTSLVLTSLAFSFAASAHALAGKRFPSTPDVSMTPGDVCKNPDEFRYPEKIPYCKRDVESQEKREIIARYDETFGYTIQQMDRQDFKIDHLIPLCMGGSNEVSNLWPQHKSIYSKTDPLEPLLCEMMSSGRILQDEAIRIIKAVKEEPDTAADVLKELEPR